MAPPTRVGRSYRPPLLAMAALVIAALTFLRPAATSPAFLPGARVADWPTADGRGGAHHSELADIRVSNVAHLEVAWTYRTGDVQAHENGLAGTTFETTPVMVDGTLYVVTPYGRVVALDAETGALAWTFAPDVDRSDEQHAMLAIRGLAVWIDASRAESAECPVRVLSPVYDGRLFALDARTGDPCSDFAGGGPLDLADGVAGIEGQRHLLRQTAPPTVIHDLVVVGSMIYDGRAVDAPSGAVRAFDIRTGALRWAWEPLLPGSDPSGRTGAANTWATITADPERDLLFVPTSSPSPDHYGGLRPGDNRYANSLVALRASTGELVWHFQMVHHDLWDYDLPSPPALTVVERDGRRIAAVAQSTKMGWIFVFDRETGEPLFPIDEVAVPASDVPGEDASPTQPVPRLPRSLAPQGLSPEDAWGLTPFDRSACRRRIERHRSDGVFTPPSLRGTIVNPGFIGGMEWGGVAYDPASGLLVTNTNSVAMVATLIPRALVDLQARPGEGARFSLAEQSGTPWAVKREPLLSPLGMPCNPPPWGMLHAVDLRSGEVAWEVPLGRMSDLVGFPTPERWGSANLGGPLITGGLVFIGATMDRRLRAFDLETGALVWRAKLPASAQSSPMTYRARPGGRQYVVVTAGGHSGLGSVLGDWVIAYALPAPPPTDAVVR